MADVSHAGAPSTPWGVLLVAGGQTHQENYALAFAADPHCRLVAVSDENQIPERRRELNRGFAAKLGLPYVDDLEQALARPDVQLISVCCETERIARVIVRCAEAGKHIYADKPIAASGSEARAVEQAVARAGVRCQMFSLVHTALAERAREAMGADRMGPLVGLHCSLFFAKGAAGTADLSRPRTEQSPVTRFTFLESKRELQCVGIYPLVLFQTLSGERFRTVEALTANYFFREHQENDVEDFATVRLTSERGTEMSIMVGRTGWLSHAATGIHELHVVGERGVARIDAFHPRWEIAADTAAWQPPSVHPEDPMGFWTSTQIESGLRSKSRWRTIEPPVRSDAAAFLDCLESNREPLVTMAMAAHAVEALDAAYESAAKGEPVLL